MRQKFDIFNHFQSFKIFIENQTQHKISIIKTNGGKEYCNNKFTKFLNTHAIVHQISCPYTLAKNGLTKRKYKHLIETTRTLLDIASLSYSFWSKALFIIVFLINRMHSSNINYKTPFEVLFKRKPQCNHIRVFNCACLPQIPSLVCHKLQSTALACIFIGYDQHYKGYQCYNLANKKLIMSKNATFDEGMFLNLLKIMQNQVVHTNV